MHTKNLGVDQQVRQLRNAVIYIRVSTEDQVKNHSLPLQERVCREHCEKNGWDVRHVFRDKGESAQTGDRTELERMIAHCEKHKGKTDVLVVYKVDRYCRNTIDHYTIKGRLLKSGVVLRSAIEPIDESPNGIMVESMWAGWANAENKAKSDRSVAGMREAASEGQPTSQAPLGYRNARNPHGQPTFVHDPIAGPLVAQAFSLMASGIYSRPEVLKKITALGLLSRNGRRLKAQSFNYLLRNVTYAGWVHNERFQITERGNFDALVPQSVFDEVQEALAGRRRPAERHVRHHPDFPLRRFVTCAACGSALTASWSKGRTKKYGNYRCHTCGAVNVTKDRLEETYEQLLGECQPSLGMMTELANEVRSVLSELSADARRVAAAARQKIEKLRARKDAMLDLRLDGNIDQATFQHGSQKLDAEIADLEESIQEALPETGGVEDVLNFAIDVLPRSAELWRALPPEQKVRFQDVIFPNGVAFDGQKFGTATMCYGFRHLPHAADQKARVASPTYFLSWVTVGGVLPDAA